MLATAAANTVFWAWPARPAPVLGAGMTDILITRDILGAAHPRGATGLVNLYAAMPGPSARPGPQWQLPSPAAPRAARAGTRSRQPSGVPPP